MNDITTHDVERHWHLVPPVRLQLVEQGTNNRSFIVSTGEGDFFLKTYRNQMARDRLAFEHALLRVLDESPLPFAVPVPIASRSGVTMVKIRSGQELVLASLSAVIPGRPARRESPAKSHACGEALAMLSDALASVQATPGIAVPDTYGDLDRVHPLISNPAEMVHHHIGDAGLAHTLMTILSATKDEWAHATASWTERVIHSDFYPSNVMMENDRATGVVDFEFAGSGYRVMDFSIGLVAFGLTSRDHEAEALWPLLEAFAHGYLHRQSLSEDELAATPVMIRMRELTSFLHWLGRMEQGLATLDDIHDRARRLLSLDNWLDRNQGELVRRLGAINGVGPVRDR